MEIQEEKEDEVSFGEASARGDGSGGSPARYFGEVRGEWEWENGFHGYKKMCSIELRF